MHIFPAYLHQLLEEIVPEEAAGVDRLGDHHALNDQDHDVQSDPFVVVEESQVATCPFFSNTACHFSPCFTALKSRINFNLFQKSNLNKIILLRPAVVWILNYTECWSASWWASSPSPLSGGGPAGNVLDEVLYNDI